MIKLKYLKVLDIIISFISILVLIFYLNNCHNSNYEILIIDVLMSISFAKIACNVHNFIVKIKAHH